jgi:hypothetical protein
LGIQFQIEDGGLVAPDAAQAPAGGHDGAYEGDFGGTGGLKEVEIGVQYFREVVCVLDGEGFGGESVFEGVA